MYNNNNNTSIVSTRLCWREAGDPCRGVDGKRSKLSFNKHHNM